MLIHNFIVAPATQKFRSSELFLVMSTQSSLPFPPQSRTTIASSEPLVERVTSKQFLLGKGGSANTVTELKKLLNMELSGSYEPNPDLATDTFPDSSLPFLINITLIEKLVPSRPWTQSTTTCTKKPTSNAHHQSPFPRRYIPTRAYH